GSRARLEVVRKFAQIVIEAPEDLLHLQSPKLARDGSHQAIEELARMQRQWTELVAELDSVLYLDALPGEAALRHAVLTFRAGDAGASACPATLLHRLCRPALGRAVRVECGRRSAAKTDQDRRRLRWPQMRRDGYASRGCDRGATALVGGERFAGGGADRLSP